MNDLSLEERVNRMHDKLFGNSPWDHFLRSQMDLPDYVTDP